MPRCSRKSSEGSAHADDEQLGINESIERSVADQDYFLDRMESRRMSISSMCSTLTELSSHCSDDMDRDGRFEGSTPPPASALSDVANVGQIPNKTSWRMAMAPEARRTPVPQPLPTVVDVLDHSPGDVVNHSPGDVPSSSRKKPRRRQKKKKKKKPTDAPPMDGEEPGETPERKKSHKEKRKESFFARRKAEMSRETRRTGAMCAKMLDGAIAVPFELCQFRPSLKVKNEQRVYHHDELKALGIETIAWDGRKSVPIKSPSGYIIALLAGRPDSPQWDDHMANLSGTMNLTRDTIRSPGCEDKQRRGRYASINTGISYGGGATAPGELRLGTRRRQLAVESLRRCQPMRALNGYVNKAFERAAPLLHGFCTRTLDLIEEHDDRLRRPFQKSPFGTITFNFGPQVCTYPHKDLKNLSWGWCSVTSLGSYDHKKGGHLVLWDLNIAVEFPPHATIFIPSALIEHSNTAIQPSETRMSITMYNSAGLFRWIAYGFMPKWKALVNGLKPLQWWINPAHMFSRVPSFFLGL